MNSLIKAGRSGHALLVTRFPSTTTSASTYSAPALSIRFRSWGWSYSG